MNLRVQPTQDSRCAHLAHSFIASRGITCISAGPESAHGFLPLGREFQQYSRSLRGLIEFRSGVAAGAIGLGRRIHVSEGVGDESLARSHALRRHGWCCLQRLESKSVFFFFVFVLCVCVFCFMMCCYYLTKSSLFTAHSFVGVRDCIRPSKINLILR